MKKIAPARKPCLVGWRKELRVHLRHSIQLSRFKRLDSDWREGALDEIITGARFCIEKNLPMVSSTLASDLNMGDANNCLLAKAGGGNLKKICSRFKLDVHNLQAMGLEWSGSTPSNSSFTTYWTWEEVANFLWRATGRFFKKHPEFGVN